VGHLCFRTEPKLRNVPSLRLCLGGRFHNPCWGTGLQRVASRAAGLWQGCARRPSSVPRHRYTKREGSHIGSKAWNTINVQSCSWLFTSLSRIDTGFPDICCLDAKRTKKKQWSITVTPLAGVKFCFHRSEYSLYSPSNPRPVGSLTLCLGILRNHSRLYHGEFKIIGSLAYNCLISGKGVNDHFGSTYDMISISVLNKF